MYWHLRGCSRPRTQSRRRLYTRHSTSPGAVCSLPSTLVATANAVDILGNQATIDVKPSARFQVRRDSTRVGQRERSDGLCSIQMRCNDS